MGYRQEMIRWLSCCGSDDLEEIKFLLKNGEATDDGYLQCKHGNYALRWLEGENIPRSVCVKAASFLRENNPKAFGLLADAMEGKVKLPD